MNGLRKGARIAGKRLTAICAVLCLALSLVPAAAFADENEDATNLANATIAGIEEAVDCTGAPITQAIEVTDPAGTPLTENVEYTVAYENNVEPGTATITISAIEGSGYTGSKSADFTINDNDVLTVYDYETVGGVASNIIYKVSGYKYGELKEMASKNSGALCDNWNSTRVQATDCYITFDQVIADAYSTVVLDDPWTNAEDPNTVSVTPKASSDGLTWEPPLSKYDLTEGTNAYWYPDVTATNTNPSQETATAAPAGVALTYGTVTLSGEQTAGDAVADALADQAYALRTCVGSSLNSDGSINSPNGKKMITDVGALNVYHEVDPSDLANAYVLGVEQTVDCTGAPITQAIEVTDPAGTPLTENVEYTVAYENNVEPGTATITISAIEGSGYTGSKSADFTINDNDVLTVYDFPTIDGVTPDTGIALKGYKYGELKEMASKNSGALCDNWNSTRVQATDCYITFDQVIADAYGVAAVTDSWTNAEDPNTVSVTPKASSDGLTWDPPLSKYDLTEGTNAYWYPDVTATNTNPSQETATAAPAGVALTYGTVTLSGEQTAGDAVADALADQAYALRTCVGSSLNSDGSINSPNGKKMITDVGALNVYHEDVAATDEEIANLQSAITSASTELNSVVISKDGSDVAPSKKWVTQEAYDALSAVISTAQTHLTMQNVPASYITGAIDALNTALSTFKAAQKSGTKGGSTTKAGKKKQNIKCKTKVKLKKNGKKVKIKVKGVKTTLCWKANKKAQKALKIVTSTKTLTLKALKKAKKGKTYKIKLWAGVGNNYAKSKVKTIKVKIK